jgi:hypothetical protein
MNIYLQCIEIIINIAASNLLKMDTVELKTKQLDLINQLNNPKLDRSGKPNRLQTDILLDEIKQIERKLNNKK